MKDQGISAGSARSGAATEANGHDTAILGDRTNMLYSSAGASLFLTLAVALIFVMVHARAGNFDTLQGLWLGALITSLALRQVLNLLYRMQALPLEPGGWLRAYRAGAAVTATCWGLTGVLFHYPDNESLQAFTLLVVAGISAGSLSVLAADFPTYRNYVILSLAPISVASTWGQGGQKVGIGLLVLLLMAFLLRNGKRTALSILRSLQLRYENVDLLEDLEREKNRVVNEAETMMGTVLASAPVALWAIDTAGRITFMDGRRLERQTGIELPRVGENLLEVFASNRQVVGDTHRALNGEQFVSEVKLDGHVFEVHYGPLEDDEAGRQGAIGVAIDISERKHHEEELSRRANYDELTGLPNRSLAMETLERAFARARRSTRSVAVFFLDLDRFKAINDTLGHRAGDQLLRQVSDRLRLCLRETDFAARISGDEFLVIAENIKRPDDAVVLANKILGNFQEPFELEGRELFATASIGVSLYPRDADSPEQLLQCADTAMYHAKEKGKNSYGFFTHEMQQATIRHLAIATELRRAIERDELELYYQPKVDIHRRRICGAEALLRWDSPELGTVWPDEFIPIAEVAGLMPQIGDWVLREACREAGAWESANGKPVQVAINVSPQQFRGSDLLADIEQALQESGLPASRLELEITESLLVQDAPDMVGMLEKLNELNVSLALDDFGTGYSSLSYLRRFPLRVLKIDKAFVQDLGRDTDSETLVYAIIAMAHSLRMKIVAEGVETRQQLEYLRARGVDLVQGYLFSRPVPAAAFRELLAEPDPFSGHHAQTEQNEGGSEPTEMDWNGTGSTGTTHSGQNLVSGHPAS